MSRDVKSLAAEIEAALIECGIDMPRGRLVTVDAPEVAEEIAVRLAANQSRAFEDGAPTPSEPSPGLLMSMAIRHDHALGMPGYRDWKVCPGIGEKEAGLHARILANTMGSMHQLWEEVAGRGFYGPKREAEYIEWAKRCGVTFDENGRPSAVLLQSEGERSDA